MIFEKRKGYPLTRIDLVVMIHSFAHGHKDTLPLTMAGSPNDKHVQKKKKTHSLSIGLLSNNNNYLAEYFELQVPLSFESYQYFEVLYTPLP